jgi:RNase P subunit RPR2
MNINLSLGVAFKDMGLKTANILCFRCAVKRIIAYSSDIIMIGDSKTTYCSNCGAILSDSVTEDSL